LTRGYPNFRRGSPDLHAGSLRIVVSDDGSGHTGGRRSGGHGLVGMRERVAV
jgi:signal transduction histidine kinase